jgi:general stress protein YciG
MPNNNPTGHNQYTKRQEQQSQIPGEQTLESTESANTAVNAAPGAAAAAPSAPYTPGKRGFAAMDEATQRGIASKGGQSQGKENNPGNFANNRDRAREAGRKGGESHGRPSLNH